MRSIEVNETENGVIIDIRLSSGEIFVNWQEFKLYCQVTTDTVYGENLHALAVGLRGEGERPRTYHQRNGTLIKMKYKLFTMVEVSMWKKDIKADNRSVAILQGMKNTYGDVYGSPAKAVSNSFFNESGYEQAQKYRNNRLSLIDAYLCSSRLPDRKFKPAYGGGMLNSPADKNKVYSDVRSFDINSSYPWSAIAANVPLTKSVDLEQHHIKNLEIDNGVIDVGDNTGFIGLFILRNFQRKSWVRFPALRANDADFISDLVTDNYGIKSGTIQIAMNPYELKLMNLQFDIESVEIISMSIHGIGKLPKAASSFIIKAYDKKNAIDKDDPDRELAKAALNTIIGFWGVDPFNSMVSKKIIDGRVDYIYTGSILKAYENYAGTDEKLGKVVGDPRTWDIRWASYTISHARLRIAMAEKAFYDAGLEVLYTDTDSLKVSGDQDTITKVFNNLNELANKEYSYDGLGQWVDETNGFNRGVFIGVKVYVLENKSGDRSATAAGVKSSQVVDSIKDLTLEQIASVGEIEVNMLRRSPGTTDPSFGFGFKQVYGIRSTTLTYKGDLTHESLQEKEN